VFGTKKSHLGKNYFDTSLLITTFCVDGGFVLNGQSNKEGYENLDNPLLSNPYASRIHPIVGSKEFYKPLVHLGKGGPSLSSNQVSTSQGNCCGNSYLLRSKGLVGTHENLLLRGLRFDTKKIVGMGGARRKTLMLHA
jgi:hypothetical protein